MDLQAATLTQKGPASKDNYSSKKRCASPLSSSPKMHHRMARINDSSSSEEVIVLSTSSFMIPSLKEKLHVSLL